MVEMNVEYEGQLHCNVKHGPSGNVISTDAPKDNNGRGESFSPTDLVGAALGSCIITIMGIYAQKNNLDIKGTTAHVGKEMVTAPIRRVGKLAITIKVPSSVPESHRAPMEKAGLSCPVSQSVHPDVVQDVRFLYV